jgi:hypothetical protein
VTEQAGEHGRAGSTGPSPQGAGKAETD